MAIKEIIRHPVLSLQLAFYFIFGRLFGKILFPRIDYNSVWFAKPWRKGWKWIWQGFIWQKILGFNKNVPWPVSHRIEIGFSPENLVFHMNDLNNFQTFGNYFQACDKIIIGKGSSLRLMLV
jgi:hypothetical protein